MAISPQQLTIYLYSAHRAVVFAIAQLSCLYIISVLAILLSETTSTGDRVHQFTDVPKRLTEVTKLCCHIKLYIRVVRLRVCLSVCLVAYV